MAVSYNKEDVHYYNLNEPNLTLYAVPSSTYFNAIFVGTPEPTVFWTRDGKIIDLDIETR